MKTFIRTIIVFVVLNLAAGSFAMVEAEEVGERQEWEAAKEEMSEAGRKMKKAGRMIKEAAKLGTEQAERKLFKGMFGIARGSSRRGRSTGRSTRKTPQYSGMGAVLVIPAGQIKAQELLTITEDMSVMSRIFDKKLDLSPEGFFGGGRGGGGYRSYGRGLLGGRMFLSRDSRATESIYLDGYGALFLMKVDFPLLPTAKVQEEEEEEVKEPADPVWEDAWREIYVAEDERQRDDDEEEYDAEKVEDLKRDLVKTLKHATNIRNLKPNEWVIVTVTGKGGRTGGAISEVIPDTDKQVLIRDRDGKVLVIKKGGGSSEMGFSSATVLTIRVKKSDVDAFSKGELDFDKFRKRVQMLTY